MELNEDAGVLICGCGYVGTRLAKSWREKGISADALVRSERSRINLAGMGINSFTLDLDTSLSHSLKSYSVIYYLVPPPGNGVLDSRLRSFLARIDEMPGRFVLFSTTGVYGDCHGNWVDETRAPAPMADRAKRRLDAENVLQQWCMEHQVDFTILRIPGIYGPGKLPIERIRAGKPVLKQEESPWSNRIHIDDLVRVCIACLSDKGRNQVFNVSDGSPSTMTDYFLQIARVFGIDEPEQVGMERARELFSAEMISYLSESRKISNAKLLSSLGIGMRYPDLVSGLQQCREEQSHHS